MRPELKVVKNWLKIHPKIKYVSPWLHAATKWTVTSRHKSEVKYKTVDYRCAKNWSKLQTLGERKKKRRKLQLKLNNCTQLDNDTGEPVLERMVSHRVSEVRCRTINTTDKQIWIHVGSVPNSTQNCSTNHDCKRKKWDETNTIDEWTKEWREHVKWSEWNWSEVWEKHRWRLLLSIRWRELRGITSESSCVTT